MYDTQFERKHGNERFTLRHEGDGFRVYYDRILAGLTIEFDGGGDTFGSYFTLDYVIRKAKEILAARKEA